MLKTNKSRWRLGRIISLKAGSDNATRGHIQKRNSILNSVFYKIITKLNTLDYVTSCRERSDHGGIPWSD